MQLLNSGEVAFTPSRYKENTPEFKGIKVKVLSVHLIRSRSEA